MGDRVATVLETILREERTLILAGRFDALGPLTTRKADMLTRIPDANIPGPRLAALADQVTRNQALLDAAIRGMSAARTRIQAVIGAGSGLSTYDRRGQKSELAESKGTLRKKA